MKNKLRMNLIVAALGLIFGCAANSFAQQDQPKLPIVGGYNPVAVTDAAIVEAANFAVRAEAKKMNAKIRLLSINRAEQQVVAGMNYKICLNVETTGRGRKSAQMQTVQTVIYKNLKQKYSLTNWIAGGRSCT